MDGSGRWPGSGPPLRRSEGGRIREEGKMKEVNTKEHTPQLAYGDSASPTRLLPGKQQAGAGRRRKEAPPASGEGRRVSGSLHFSMRRGRAPLRDILPCLTSSEKGLC